MDIGNTKENEDNRIDLPFNLNAFKLAYDNNPQAFCVVQEQNKVKEAYDVLFLYVNGAYEKMSGLSAENLVGNTYTDITGKPCDEWKDICVNKASNQCLKRISIPSVNGEISVTAQGFQIAPDYCGINVNALATEMTEIKEKDLYDLTKIKTERELYQSILDTSSNMITVIDVDTYKIVYANAIAKKVTEDMPEAYVGSICYKSISHCDKPCADCILVNENHLEKKTKELVYGNRFYRMTYKFITWKGRKSLLEFSEDITEEIRAREIRKKLDYDKEKEKILLDSISGGVALYHIMEDGVVKISYMSEGLAGILGYTSQEFMEKYGEDTTYCVVEEDRIIIGEAIKKMLKTNTPISTHYRCYTKYGEKITVSFDGNLVDIEKKMPGEIATLYAVQMQISDEHQKEMQKEEIRHKMIDHVPGGIGIYDLYQGVATLKYLNNAYLNMMGLKKKDREKYYDNNIVGVFHPEDRHILDEIIEDVYQGKKLTNVIFRIKSGSGKWKWVNLIMSIVQEDNGHYTGYASLNDFDKIIKSQQDMEAAHKKEETLLSSIPGGIAIYRVKKNGKVATEYVSEPLAKMCGYTAEEFQEYLKEDSLINLVPEDIPTVNQAVEKALKNKQNISIMYRIYKKDKTPILIRLDANIISTELLGEDEVAVFYAVHTLVSEESKQVMEEQKTLRMLLNAVPAGIGIFEINNGVLNQSYMNDEFFEILHCSRENRNIYSRKNAIDIIHKEDIDKVKSVINDLVGGASAAQVDFRIIDGFGKYIWFHVTASVAERKEGYARIFTAFVDCTESKEQELLLRQNERAVELAQTQGDLSIWIYNIDKRTIYNHIKSSANGSMGYKISIDRVPESLIESGRIHPEDIEELSKAYRDLSDGKEKVDVTYRLKVEKTGEFNWLRMFYQRMENANQNGRMAVGFSMNVNKQQEAIKRYQVEQALREKMNDSVLLYIEYNLTKDCYEVKGKLTESHDNQNWQGASSKEYISSLLKFVEEKYVDEVAEKMYSSNLMKAFLSGTTKVQVEYRSKSKNNMPSCWYRINTSLVKRPDTGDIMAFIYVEDIEKEKERKLALENSLSDGIESIAVIRISDGETKLIRDAYDLTWSKDIKEYFTYDDEFVWNSHFAVVEEEREFSYKSALLSNILKELEHQEIFQYSIGARNVDGVFKRQLFRFRYLDDRKMSIVLSVSDITSVYEEEQTKKRQIEHALAETKKASSAKADFYSRMSHDMRTPMNGILGMTALSENENNLSVLHNNLEKIHESGEYLLNLINDTLDIQRIESGKLKLESKIVYTKKSIGSILEMVKPMADAKGVILEYDKGNANIDWYVRTDPIRAKQIFVNLLSNAIKFTPTGGMVKFSSNITRRDDKYSYVEFTIKDTGIGMSEDFLKNEIFQPFSQESNQVTSNYAGSGLGLSIVKSLVEMMNGHIEVKSELGVGTTFMVYLNFERVEKANAEHILSEKKISSKDVVSILKGKRILVVEDHPLNAEITKKLLKNVGCVVTWAKDGKQGLDVFEASENKFYDVILMDIRMPVMDGLESAKKIRALKREDAKSVPIIAMTANAYEDDIKKSIKAGMNAHLGKPLEIEKMYQTIIKCITAQ